MCQAIQEMNREAAREATESTFVSTCKESGVSLTDTISKFAVKFKLSENDSSSIVKKYWIVS